MEDESKDWMGVSYGENVIEYDEYSDYQDDTNVEIDVEVHSEIFLEYTDSAGCDQTEYANADPHSYHIGEEEEVYSTPSIVPVIEQISNIDTEAEVSTTSHRSLEHTSDVKQQQLNQNLRSLRLKCHMRRENNRLKRKLLNCRICGTNPRFLSMKIRRLQADKQKLLEETSILRLTKEKLMKQVTLIKSNLIVE